MNVTLKRLLAYAMLDVSILREVFRETFGAWFRNLCVVGDFTHERLTIVVDASCVVLK